MCYNNSSTSSFYGVCTFILFPLIWPFLYIVYFLPVDLLLMQVQADKQHFLLYFKYVY